MPTRPNVLFVMTDQESVSLSGCYGNPVIKTPARDSIARNGIRFNNHYLASFPCCPSRATMITGLWPHHHGVVHQNIVLQPTVETLGSQFRSAGYDTTWIGKSHLGGWFEPHDEATCPYSDMTLTEMGYSYTDYPGGAGGEDYALNGFETWISGWTDYRNYLQTTKLPKKIKNDRWVGGHAVMESGPDSEHAYSRLTAKHHMAHWMAGQAVEQIEASTGSDSPFCMVLSFYAPHHPVAPPKPYDSMYSVDDMELPESYRASTGRKNLPGHNAESGHSNHIAEHWSEAQAKDYLARYYGYVTYLDEQLARVLDALKEQDLYDDTIVVFTSDHGDMLCEHGMIYKHTFNGYDTLMKVPLLLQWPKGIGPGQVHGGLSSHLDLVPTLLDLAGVTQRAEMDGQSMAPALTGRSTAARNEIFTDVMNQGYMTRKGRWKFVLNAAVIDGQMVRKCDELFDMEKDPHEMVNLAFEPRQAERVGRMKQRIFSWLTESGHPYVETLREAAALELDVSV